MKKTPLKLITMAVLSLTVALVMACGGGSNKNSNPTATAATSGAGSQPTAASSSNGGASSQPTAASSANGSSAAPSPTAASQGSSSSSGGGDNELIVTVMTNFANAKSWKAQISDSSDASAKGTFEYLAPDKYHITLTDYEVIVIGTDTYVHVGGSWTKTTTTAGAGPAINPAAIQSSIEAVKAATVTKGGTDNVNGTKCQLYTYKDSDTNIEVCIANNLPVRLVEDNGTSKTTIVFSDFNSSNIAIKAPI